MSTFNVYRVQPVDLFLSDGPDEYFYNKRDAARFARSEAKRLVATMILRTVRHVGLRGSEDAYVVGDHREFIEP